MKNFFWKIKMIPKFLKDDDVSVYKKVLIILSLTYAIFPFDFIPDPIIIIGWVDDIIVLLYSYSKLSDYLEKYLPKKSKVLKFKKEDIVEDVDYDIEDKE